MTAGTRFAFPAETLAFLADLRQHNDKPWFDANRSRYEAGYLEPAKAFVDAVAPALDAIVAGIIAEPRVLGSIFRINRDTRFSTDKRPYKDHLDLWFWEGDRKAAVSGLFLRVSPDAVIVGAGAHNLTKDQLSGYRAAVVNPDAGPELTESVRRLERAGHEVGGETYRRAPRGAERFLRHSALFVHADLSAESATDPQLVPGLVQHWRTFAALHRWLVTYVQRD